MSIYLLELRQTLSLSQSVMSRLLGISRMNLNSVEQGRRPLIAKLDPMYKTLLNISQDPAYATYMQDMHFEEEANALLRKKLLKEQYRLSHTLVENERKLAFLEEKYQFVHKQIRSLDSLFKVISGAEVLTLKPLIEKEKLQLQHQLSNRLQQAWIREKLMVAEKRARLEVVELLLLTT